MFVHNLAKSVLLEIISIWYEYLKVYNWVKIFIVMIIIWYLRMDIILVWNDPLGFEMSLNK